MATWVATLDFGDTTGARDITSSVATDTFRRNRVLHNDLHACSWSLDFDMVRNPTISTLLLGHEGSDVEIAVTKDGADYFHGILTTDFAVELHTRLQAVPIKAVDNGEKLRKVIKGDGAGNDIAWAGYSICDPGDSAESIVHQLLTLAGFTTANWTLGAGTTIATEIDYFVSYIGDHTTYYEVLDEILFEHGYYFTFGADGKFTIKDAYPADTSVDTLFDSSNIVGELSITRKADRIEGCEVEYRPRRLVQSPRGTVAPWVELFSDNTGGSGDGRLPCYIEVQPGAFYPVGSDSRTTYLEYKCSAGELVYATDVILSINFTSANLVVNEFTDCHLRAKIQIENTGGDTEWIRRLGVRGKAYYRDFPILVESNNHANTQRLKQLSTQWIASDTAATRLAEGQEDYYRYSNLVYQWRSRAAAAVGSIALVQDDILSTSNIVRVTGAVDNERYGEVKYTGEGLAAFLAGVVTINSCVKMAPVVLPPQMAHRVTVAAYDYAGAADYYAGDTDAYSTIKEAIDYVVEAYSGGTVELTEGTFKVLTAVPLASNVHLIGRGAGVTVVEKNCNDYAIEAVGTSGTHLENVGIKDMTVTRDEGDTSTNALLYTDYVDNLLIANATVLNSYDDAIRVNHSTGLIHGNKVYWTTGPGSAASATCGIYLGSCHGMRVQANEVGPCLGIRAGPVRGIMNQDSNQEIVTDNYIHGLAGITNSFGIYTAGAMLIRGNTVEDVYTGDDDTGLNKGAGIYVDGGSALDGSVVMTNICRNNGNLIDRGNCESATPPAMAGETAVVKTEATFARSGDTAYGGDYSYLFTKTNAAGNPARVSLGDTESTSDLHGFVAGETYTLSARVAVPSGGAEGTEVSFGLAYYDSAAWTFSADAGVNTYDEFQELTKTVTIPATATAAVPRFQMASPAEVNETFYVDDIRVRPDGVGNDHDQNYVDAGTGTLTTGNSWEL